MTFQWVLLQAGSTDQWRHPGAGWWHRVLGLAQTCWIQRRPSAQGSEHIGVGEPGLCAQEEEGEGLAEAPGKALAGDWGDGGQMTEVQATCSHSVLSQGRSPVRGSLRAKAPRLPPHTYPRQPRAALHVLGSPETGAVPRARDAAQPRAARVPGPAALPSEADPGRRRRQPPLGQAVRPPVSSHLLHGRTSCHRRGPRRPRPVRASACRPSFFYFYSQVTFEHNRGKAPPPQFPLSSCHSSLPGVTCPLLRRAPFPSLVYEFRRVPLEIRSFEFSDCIFYINIILYCFETCF